VVGPNFTIRRNQPQSGQDDAPPDRWWLGHQSGTVDFNSRLCPRNKCLEPALGEFIEPLTLFSDNRGRPCNGRAGSAARGKVQFRQDLVSDSITRVGEIFVRFVIHPRLTTGLEVTAKIVACDIEQGSNDFAASWKDSAQADRPSPANELEQERFGLIISRVAHRNLICRDGLRGPVKKVISQTPSGVLGRQPLRLRV
jgi:hypothetical protein